jgi:homocysteine S-methyltransferase
MTSLAEAMTTGVVVLDGGLATELERRGNDLSTAVWSARLLIDDPDEIVAAHRAFFEAGAMVATSASYQASFEGFGRLGIDTQRSADLMRLSVALARRARDEVTPKGWVAASVGPYGAMLADGSEYTGDYRLSVAELRRFHRRRLGVLAECGADVLAIETIPCLAEVEAVLAEVEALGMPAWLALTCDGLWTRAGESAAQALAMGAEVDNVIAVGVNCTDPIDAGRLVHLAAAASGKPVVVYPNSGERWDRSHQCWTGAPDFSVPDVNAWIAAGARLVGGCCRIGPSEIAQIAAVAAAAGRSSTVVDVPEDRSS